MEPAGGAQDFEVPPKENHPNFLQNETPNFMVEGFYQVSSILQSYGWFILLGLGVLYYLKTKLDPTLAKLREKREQQQEYANYDEETVRRRHDAMEAHRQRLQEQHDAQAALFAEQQKKKEEEKRKAKIEDWDRHKQGLGYRSKHKTPEDSEGTSSGPKPKPNKKPHRRDNDYNPLLGSGGGGGTFRPPRRGGAGGG